MLPENNQNVLMDGMTSASSILSKYHQKIPSLIEVNDKGAHMSSPLLEAQKLFSTTQIMGCLLGAAYATDIPASMGFGVQIEREK
jgi:hypothetical protein